MLGAALLAAVTGLGPGNTFDILSDGHIVASSADETTDEPVALILNWTSEID